MKRVFLFGFVLLITLLGISCGQSFELINGNDQLQSYTVEELTAVYNQYHERFQRVAELVSENESIEQIMLNSMEEVVSIYSDAKKPCFTEEEWNEIEELFHLTGMNRIERSIKSGKNVIQFLFRKGSFTTKLFYCETTDEKDLLYHKQQTSIFQKIEEYWWVGYTVDGYAFDTDVKNGIDFTNLKTANETLNNYTIEDDTVIFDCELNVLNASDQNKTYEIIGLFPEDQRNGLILESALNAKDPETGSFVFSIEAGSESRIQIVFIGTFAGNPEKVDRNAPEMMVYEVHF